MGQPALRLERASEETRRVVRKTRPAIVLAARIGHASIGLVYLLIGGLSAAAALGARSEPSGTEESLQAMLGTAYGHMLLAVLAVGLAAYAVWELVEAAADPDRRGSDAKGIVARLGDVVGAVIYGSLSVAAATMAFGQNGGSGDDKQARDVTALVMGKPLGRWLVGIAGVVMIAAGLFRIWRGWQADLDRRLHLGTLPDTARRAVVQFGRIGFAAHGIVLGIMGAFVVVATIDFDPSEARGLGGALRALERQPYGRWLLLVIAVGLACYGLFELVRARYRPFTVD
jgi:uncharacterized protein DUF1206